jgi:transposase
LFLETLLNQPCCPALTVKMQTQVTVALGRPMKKLVQQLPTQPTLGIDESPTKEGATKSWLWTFVTGLFTVFACRGTRAATVLTELLTDRLVGVVMCDRAKMYWKLGRLQWCWAHLKRDYQALADSPRKLATLELQSKVPVQMSSAYSARPARRLPFLSKRLSHKAQRPM